MHIHDLDCLMPEIPMEPPTCFNEGNQRDVLSSWEQMPSLMQEIMKVTPPSIVMPGSYVTKLWFAYFSFLAEHAIKR